MILLLWMGAARAAPVEVTHVDDPAWFERVQPRGTSAQEAQLNFEIQLEPTGATPVVINGVDITYDNGAVKTFSQAVTWEHLRDGDRTGFGTNQDGYGTADDPTSTSESLTDLVVDGDYYFASTTTMPAGAIFSPTGIALSRYGKDGRYQQTVPIVFPGYFEGISAAIAVPEPERPLVGGSVHVQGTSLDPHGMPYRFAVARIDEDLLPEVRVTTPFTDCSAFLADLELTPPIGVVDPGQGQIIAVGTAKCTDGTVRLAYAGYHDDLSLAVSRTISIPEGAVEINGSTHDPATNAVYVVGRVVGAGLFLGRLTPWGFLDPTFGGGDGYVISSFPSYTDANGFEVQLLDDGRVVVGGEGTKTGLRTFLGARYDAGVLDPTFNGSGFVTHTFPGYPNAVGRDVEICDDGSVMVVGNAYTTTNGAMAMAVWTEDGVAKTAFDADGRATLVFSSTTAAPSANAALYVGGGYDWVTLAGGSSNRLATAQYGCDDGLPNHSGLLTADSRRVLLWPDTGKVIPGQVGPFSAFDWDDLPESATAKFKFASWPSKVPMVDTLLTAIDLEAFDDAGYLTPGALSAEDHWYVNAAHAIDEDHRNAMTYASSVGYYQNVQKYAYDLGVRRWDGSAWQHSYAEGDPEWCDDTLCNPNLGPCGILPSCNPNENRFAYGVDLRPIADGEIVHCTRGVVENSAPRIKDGNELCVGNVGPNGEDCEYSGSGNGYRIRFADGTVVGYNHMQNNLPDELCNLPDGVFSGLVDPPVPVTTTTLLGHLGNSGNSEGPHLHIAHEVLNDETDPGGAADGIPLHFTGVIGVEWNEPPEYGTDEPVATAQITSTVLVPWFPYEGCYKTEPIEMAPWTDLAHEEYHPDGNFGGETYCPDDPDLGERVCIEDGVGGGSHCELCEGASLKPDGCACTTDEGCASGTCQGLDGELGEGRCYPYDDVPEWQCPNACSELFGTGAWCYNEWPGGHAKCFDDLTDPSTADACYDDGGQSAYDDECAPECDEFCGDLEGPFENLPASWECIDQICVPGWVE